MGQLLAGCRIVLLAWAAAKFVTLAERFGVSVDVRRDGQSVLTRSIMGLMTRTAGLARAGPKRGGAEGRCTQPTGLALEGNSDQSLVPSSAS